EIERGREIQSAVEISASAWQASRIADRCGEIDRRRQQIPCARNERAGMNLWRVWLHEEEDTRKVGRGAHDERCSGHFLGRIASNRNAPFHSKRCEEQNASRCASCAPAHRNLLCGGRIQT